MSACLSSPGSTLFPQGVWGLFKAEAAWDEERKECHLLLKARAEAQLGPVTES